MRTGLSAGSRWLPWACVVLPAIARAASTNAVGAPLSAPGSALPDTAGSIFRVLAALAFVLVVFGGILWALKNWQQLLIKRGSAPQLVIAEARSLGNRSTLYLLKHQERSFLIASSPQGVHFLADLSSSGISAPATAAVPASDFEKALRQSTREGV